MKAFKKSLAVVALAIVGAIAVASPAQAGYGYYHHPYWHGGYWHAGYYYGPYGYAPYGRVVVAPGYYPWVAPTPVVYANPYPVYAAPVGVSLNIR